MAIISRRSAVAYGSRTTVYSPGAQSVGFSPMRALRMASAARFSQFTAPSFQPDACAHPEDVELMTTVDASTNVVSHSANTPLEFATPSIVVPVVMDPAAL